MATRLGRIPGVVLISVAAVMWGTDAIFRRPLAHSTSAATIVFGEHVILALWRAGPRYVLAGVGVGAGASALATILFTQAFAHGDPITPIVLQKIQPLVAVAGAALLLGERPRPRFTWFLVPALLGIWLIGVQHPLGPHAHGLAPIVESLGAAVLWGLGTVLGRFLSRELSFEHIVTVRFAFGLVASGIAGSTPTGIGSAPWISAIHPRKQPFAPSCARGWTATCRTSGAAGEAASSASATSSAASGAASSTKPATAA